MSKITVIFLAANPASTSQLRLDEEIRAINEKIRASKYRDSLELISMWAIRPDDLLQVLNERKPHIVHFSGHGIKSGEIVLVDNAGNPKVVDAQAIKALFTALKHDIRLVLLNACYSQSQAVAITQVVDCAIGMNRAIGDQAAVIFAAAFYRALGFGCSVLQAFEQAKTALLLEGLREENTPQLQMRNGVDPAQMFIVLPEAAISDAPRTRANLDSARPSLKERAVMFFLQAVITAFMGGVIMGLVAFLTKPYFNSLKAFEAVKWEQVNFERNKSNASNMKKERINIYRLGEKPLENLRLAFTIEDSQSYEIIRGTLQKYEKSLFNVFLSNKKYYDVEGSYLTGEAKTSKYLFLIDKLSPDWIYELALDIKSKNGKPIENYGYFILRDEEDARVTDASYKGLEFKDYLRLYITEISFMADLFLLAVTMMTSWIMVRQFFKLKEKLA